MTSATSTQNLADGVARFLYRVEDDIDALQAALRDLKENKFSIEQFEKVRGSYDDVIDKMSSLTEVLQSIEEYVDKVNDQ